MRRKRSNIFKKTKDKINIDSLAENVQIPFASFVDHKMIKDKRLVGIINKDIDTKIGAIQKRYELQKNAFLTQFKHKVLKRNSLVDINSRSVNHSTMSGPEYEGTILGQMRSNSTTSTNRQQNHGPRP